MIDALQEKWFIYCSLRSQLKRHPAAKVGQDTFVGPKLCSKKTRCYGALKLGVHHTRGALSCDRTVGYYFCIIMSYRWHCGLRLLCNYECPMALWVTTFVQIWVYISEYWRTFFFNPKPSLPGVLRKSFKTLRIYDWKKNCILCDKIWISNINVPYIFI